MRFRLEMWSNQGANLETAFFEIFDGKTPAMWLKHSYPSLNLASNLELILVRLVDADVWRVDRLVQLYSWLINEIELGAEFMDGIK